MSVDMKQADLALARTKIAFINSPKLAFFSNVLMLCQTTWTDETPYIRTDGITIDINPERFLGLSPNERMSTLLLAVKHITHGHVLPSRIGARDLSVFSEAADHVINLELDDTGMSIQGHWRRNKAFAGMPTEQVYEILMENKDKQNPQHSPTIMPAPVGTSGEGGNSPSQGGSGQSSAAAHEAQVLGNVQQAALAAMTQGGEAAGSVPGNTLIDINDRFSPTLPWETILEDEMHSIAADDYSYRRLNKKYLPDFILPTLYSEGMGTLACAVDTSGSVTDDQFMAFISQMHKMQDVLKPETMIVVDFDTRINHIHEIDVNTPVNSLAFSGRGGTNMEPVFEHFEKTPPDVLVVFSDLECSHPSITPAYPVIWVKLPGNYGFTPEFGRVVDFNV